LSGGSDDRAFTSAGQALAALFPKRVADRRVRAGEKLYSLTTPGAVIEVAITKWVRTGSFLMSVNWQTVGVPSRTDRSGAAGEVLM